MCFHPRPRELWLGLAARTPTPTRARGHHELLTKTSTPEEAISHASQRPEAGLEDLGQRSGAVLVAPRLATPSC